MVGILLISFASSENTFSPLLCLLIANEGGLSLSMSALFAVMREQQLNMIVAILYFKYLPTC